MQVHAVGPLHCEMDRTMSERPGVDCDSLEVIARQLQLQVLQA